MSAGATGLPRAHRDAYESQMRAHEHAYPGVRRHALAGTRRHFDRPLLAGEREHQRHLRDREQLGEGEAAKIQRELDTAASSSRDEQRSEQLAGPRAARRAVSAARGGGNTVLYFAGLALALSLVYLLVAGKGIPEAFAGIVSLFVGAVRAFIAPVDPIAHAERALGAAPLSSSGSAPGSSSTPSPAPAAGVKPGKGALGGLFPSGTTYSVSRTDAGKDFAGIHGTIGAFAPGTIASVHQYSGFGTTVFEELSQPVAGRRFAYYALESGGGSPLVRAGSKVGRGSAIARGAGGVIEVGLSSRADVSGIEQRTSAPEHRTPMGEAFARFLGL